MRWLTRYRTQSLHDAMYVIQLITTHNMQLLPTEKKHQAIWNSANFQLILSICCDSQSVLKTCWQAGNWTTSAQVLDVAIQRTHFWSYILICNGMAAHDMFRARYQLFYIVSSPWYLDLWWGSSTYIYIPTYILPRIKVCNHIPIPLDCGECVLTPLPLFESMDMFHKWDLPFYPYVDN